jgi:hypothetical protein
MDRVQRGSLIAATFLLVAGLGVAISYAAPYRLDGDHIVYLLGALQTRDGGLPDPEMLSGLDYGPYIFPKILLAWYEPLGHVLFKSIALTVLVVATGLAGYALFRLLGLSWAPALVWSVLLLVPRDAAGTETFGLLTFREAIGRAVPVPVFLLATGVLFRRSIEGRSAWPVFGVLGLLMLLHPSTVMTFAGVAMATVAALRIVRRERLLAVARDSIVSGVAFVVGGAYFFLDVLQRLSRSVPAEGVAGPEYLEAVLFRFAFEFPAETFLRYRHMAVVSLVFLIPLAVPAMRRLAGRHPLAHAREVTAFGIAMMVASLAIGLVLPAVNLYLMEHADWPYVFQQWSRAAKFFYVGLFVALVPAVNALAEWHRACTARFRHVLVALLVALGLASSSYGFEVVQFAIGYQNYETAYIPQALSGASDDVTAEQYREVCGAIEALGGGARPRVVSEDFAFRYYCRADLYTTEEEGLVYSQFPRAELVRWYRMVMAQNEALASADPETIAAFAAGVGARFVVLPRTDRYAGIARAPGTVVTTARHIVIRVDERPVRSPAP